MESKEYDALAASKTCVICDTPGLPRPQRNHEYGVWIFKCTNCGTFKISESGIAGLCQNWKLNKPKHVAMISSRVRRMQGGEKLPYLPSEWIQKACESEPEFPNAFEQVENLIIFMAESLGPGETMHLSKKTCQAAVGAADDEVMAWVLRQAADQNWIDGIPREGVGVFEFIDGYLTLTGWEWYNEIGKHKRSRTAFMAMQYGDEQLHKIVDDYLKPAVAQTGFELRLLVDKPEAGIIDNRLRVEIRRSRFVIADLTHHNNGAYWEAGFGEGLGLPVIYTCREDVLAEKENKKVHFDTRNSLIVPWTEENPNIAVGKLKAAIRNTLPDEAILEDPC